MTLSKEALELKKEVELYSQLSNPYERVLQAKRIQDRYDINQKKLNELEAFSRVENDPKAKLYSVREIVDKVIDEMEEKAGLPKGWVKQLASKSKEERTEPENHLDT